MQIRPRNLKFQLPALATCTLAFLLGTVAFLSPAQAGNLANNPNALQIVQQFIYKPKPTELLLKPQGEKTKPKKPARDARN